MTINTRLEAARARHENAQARLHETTVAVHEMTHQRQLQLHNADAAEKASAQASIDLSHALINGADAETLAALRAKIADNEANAKAGRIAARLIDERLPNAIASRDAAGHASLGIRMEFHHADFLAAVDEWAEAMKPLWPLARRVHDAARMAGVSIEPTWNGGIVYPDKPSIAGIVLDTRGIA
ncbi:hypothetical protein [Caballeronia sp. NCTM5]|uniref:hypothetical protein n=1 Tax=Caballeronia sp. NCTM5 TaxID=2921755 RepID=UPI002027BD86|nr:hypothetical protein [Caballeronia sp. NCTM5]